MSGESGFTEVQPVRLYERIVQQVEDGLALGTLKPGQRLPSERELVHQFKTSRSTVREALRVLESHGVIRSRPGDPQGAELLAFTASGLSKQMTRLAQVDGLSLAELIAFRMILDSSANKLAARLRTPAELEAIEKTIVDMQEALESGFQEFSAADVAFHDSIAVASHNALIQVCHQVVHGVVLSLISDKIANADNSTELMQESLRHHREVLDAIRDGDGTTAARTSQRNLFNYYVGYVAESEREQLLALLDP